MITQTKRIFKTMAVLGAVSFLGACGGGSSSGGGSGSGGGTNPPPSPPESTSLGVTTTALGSVMSVDGEVDSLTSGDTVSTSDKTGFSLYVFDDDGVGASACEDGCLDNWPALLAKADDDATGMEPLTIVDRGDGTLQWALRDKPLYFFAGDDAVGDLKGDGVGGVWHAAETAPILENTVNVGTQGEHLVASGMVLTGLDTSTETSLDIGVVNKDRFTLYTFDNDVVGDEPSCNGGCLQVWPPLLAQDGDVAESPYSLVERAVDDAGGVAMQWAYNGKPLYFFRDDLMAGDALGEAANSAFPIARFNPVAVTDSALGSLLGTTNRVKLTSDDSTIQTEARQGFTLYHFDNDTAGVSNCSGGCLENWPALMAHKSAVATAPFSLVDRGTGDLQWALNEMPLYFYAGDAAAGDVNGEGVGGVWHVARTAPVATFDDDALGTIFKAHGNIVDAGGAPDTTRADFTIYLFDDDTAGISNCTGGCAGVWPPLFATADAEDFGDFTVFDRTDPAGKQWAYKDAPLYFYVGDTQAGDTTGVYDTWHEVTP